MKYIYCPSRKFLILLFLFILFLLPHSFIHAQSLDIGLSNGTQSIFNKNIPLYLNLGTDYPLTNLKVQWILPAGINTLPGESTTYTTNINPGNTLYDHIVVYPSFPGNYPITVNVSGIFNGYPFSRSAIQPLNLNVDNGLHLTNNQTSYTIKKVFYVFLAILSLVVFVIISKDVYNYFKLRFKTWLNKEG